MDLTALAEGAADVALSLIGMAFPVALPFIVIAKEAIPAIIAAKPYVVKAIHDGESAVHAAEAASPGLVNHLKALAGYIDPKGATPEQHLENILYVTAGYAVPGWTDEETKRWMDSTGSNPNAG